MRASTRNPLLLLLLLAACGGGDVAGTSRPARGRLAAPATLDLGTVALGATAEGTLRLENAGTGELRIEAIDVPAPFSRGEFPAVLAPGAARSVPVSFAPAASGPASATARIRAGGAVHEVRLSAMGGETPLRCTPGAVDLGRPLLESTRSFRLECANESDAAVEVRIEYEGWRDVAGLPEGSVAIPAGEGTVLDLAYRPSALAPLDATIRFRSGAATLAEVPVRARPIAVAVEVSDEVTCPGGLDLGFTPPGTSTGRTFSLTNVGDRPVGVTVAAVEGPFGVAAAVPFELPVDDPATEENEGIVEVPVTFAPTALGPSAGRIELAFDEPAIPPASACVSAHGGGPVLSCAPAGLDLGPVVVGLPRRATVSCTNVGTDVPGTDDDRLRLVSVEAEGAGFSAEAAWPVGGLRAGESTAVEVSFAPEVAGQVEGRLAIARDDVASPPLHLPLAGTGVAAGPCRYRVEPAVLDFGPVAAGGTPATLTISIHNEGDDRCLVRGLGLAPGTAPAFSLVRGPVPVEWIEPQASLQVEVGFAPSGAEAVAGGLAFGISSGERPAGLVHLAGATAPPSPCLRVFPESVDFGDVAPGCTSLAAELVLANTCGEPVPVGEFSWLGAAAPFRLAAPPAATPVAPGETAILTVEYRPTAAGEHLAGLRRTAAGDGVGRLVPIRGRAATPSGVETFALPRKADVLFVMDNSYGGGFEQFFAVAALSSFLRVADERDVDWQFGVTTVGLAGGTGLDGSGCPGGVQGGEDGRLFPVDGARPRIVRAAMPDAWGLATSNLSVGYCHRARRGLEAAYRALSPPVIDHADDPRHPEPDDGNLGFLRPDADLAVIVLSAHVDGSPGTAAYYAVLLGAARREAWREPRFAGHAITGPPGTACVHPLNGVAEPGDDLIAWSQATGGHRTSICSEDWPTDFARLGRAAFGRTRFPLKGRPAGTLAAAGGDLEVRVDGVPWAGPWRWDEAAHAVVFEPDEAPEPGTTVEFHYTPACVPGP